MSNGFCVKHPSLPGEQHLTAAAVVLGARTLQMHSLLLASKATPQHNVIYGGRAAQDCSGYFRNHFEGGWVKGEEIMQIPEGKLLFEQEGQGGL